jgi:hypothetical protein
MIDMGITLSPQMKKTTANLCSPYTDYADACLIALTALHKKRGNISIGLLNILIRACSQLGLDGGPLLDSISVKKRFLTLLGMKPKFGVEPTKESYHELLKVIFLFSEYLKIGLFL